MLKGSILYQYQVKRIRIDWDIPIANIAIIWKLLILKKEPTVLSFVGRKIFQSKLCFKVSILYQYQVKRIRIEKVLQIDRIDRTWSHC